MTSPPASTPYPSSTLQYPHLDQMLDSRMSATVSSTSSTFTLPTSTVISNSLSSNTIPFSWPLPPIWSVLPTATQSSTSLPLPLLPHDAVATSAHLQQFSAIRQLTRILQQRKPRHPERQHLPPGEAGSPTKRIAHTAVYKQKLTQYHIALKLH